LPRFSHHREPVLNHTNPVNPRHGLRCTADASPFAILAGQEALCCDHLNLAYSQVYARINPDCRCPAGAMHVEASDWSSVRQAIPVSRSGASVFCSCPRTTPWCPHSVRAVSASSHHLPAHLLSHGSGWVVKVFSTVSPQQVVT